MKSFLRNEMTWSALVVVILSQVACQQAGTPTTNSGSAEANTVNANASAPAATPSAPPATPDPAMATGPVALPTDAALPADCQEAVRVAQACLDNIQGEVAERAFREQSMRTSLDSSRRSWAQVEGNYLTRMCASDLTRMRELQSRFECRPR